jgi:hypothetical protein
MTDTQCGLLLEKSKARLRGAGYDGSLLKTNDLLIAIDSRGEIMKDKDGEPDLIICNFEVLWKISETNAIS